VRSFAPSLAVSAALAALAVPSAARPAGGPIQDNSFLLEEAYNQEPGVIQHISTFSRPATGGAWQYTFTEEWPAGGLADQVSVTGAVQRAGRLRPPGMGDLALNYRRQVLGDGGAPVALAPRLSLLLPTGSAAGGRGAGGAGVQVNLPLSAALGRRFVTHVNLGGTVVPAGRTVEGAPARSWGWAFGQSLVWLLHPSVNLLVEALATGGETTAGGATVGATTWTLNPGLRAALDLPGRLQVVAGLSAPVGVGPSRGERGLFLSLSFEHPLAALGG